MKTKKYRINYQLFGITDAHSDWFETKKEAIAAVDIVKKEYQGSCGFYLEKKVTSITKL